MSIRYRGLAAHETKVDDDEELKKAKADQVRKKATNLFSLSCLINLI